MIAGASRFVFAAHFSVLSLFVLPFLSADATLGLAGFLCVGLTRRSVSLLTTASTGMGLVTELTLKTKRPHPGMLGVSQQRVLDVDFRA